MTHAPDDARPARTARLTGQALTTAAECPRRLWLRQHDAREGTPPTDHQRVLRERTAVLERETLARFPDRVGPIWNREGSFAAAAAESLRRLREERVPLVRPALLSPDGRRSSVPLLLWWDGGTLAVLDVRLAHRPQARSDFALQLAHDRALLREIAGIEPGRFEIVNGHGETIAVKPASESAYARALAAAEAVLAREDEPDLLLSHSACRACAFYDHCWDRAEAERRIEILPEVQGAHVAAYHAAGVRTLVRLAALATGRTPAGLPEAVVRRAAIAAAAWRDDRAVWLRAPRLPEGPCVWLDFEGDARGEDAGIPIYLWGLAREPGGDAAPRGEAIVAGLDDGGDARAWQRFVARADQLLAAEPGLRFVHWDQYEPLWVRRYAARHGAPPGFLERFERATFDLKRALDQSVRLPLRSYSIKFVARWLGFAWRNPESGSEWSAARFHRACATGDAAERERLLREIAEYNEDDLLAMRAIWRWMRASGPA
ncbi:MAG TPA: TM0106 family RecB-like putative nuclease [Candidatus Acidoferrales bacterium]|nr:TM0106 family RecB-like putative nuclease [Candidatus Acidoferrales bacterium]